MGCEHIFKNILLRIILQCFRALQLFTDYWLSFSGLFKEAQRTREAPTDCHIHMFWSCLVNITNKTFAISLDSTDLISTAIPRNNVHRYQYHFMGSCKGKVKFTAQAIWREVVDLFLPYSPSENSFLASLAYHKHLQRHSGSKITIRKSKYELLPRYDVG